MKKLFEVGGDHIIVAGGAVVKALTTDPNNRREWEWRDVDLDIFFVGLKADAATALLGVLVDVLMEEKNDAELVRSQHMVAVRADGGRRVYQFVLRLYDFPDQVLGGFDLSCCALGYSPSRGWFGTPLGAWSVATNTVILDTSRRSTSFE